MNQQGAPPASAPDDMQWASAALSVSTTGPAGMPEASHALAAGDMGNPDVAAAVAAAGAAGSGSPSQSTAPSKSTRRSCFRGLSWKDGRWRVRINVMGKQHHVGRYYSEIEAARAFDRAALCIYGDRALTNFGLAAAAADPTPVSAHLRMLALEKQKVELLQAAKAQQQHQQQQQAAAAASGAYLTPEGVLVAPAGAGGLGGLMGVSAFGLPSGLPHGMLTQQAVGSGGDSGLTHMGAAGAMQALGGGMASPMQLRGSSSVHYSPAGSSEHALYQVQAMQQQQQQQQSPQLLYAYTTTAMLPPQPPPVQQQQPWMSPGDQAAALVSLSSYNPGGTNSSGGVVPAGPAQSGLTYTGGPVYHVSGGSRSSPFAAPGTTLGFPGPHLQAHAVTGMLAAAPGAAAAVAPATPGASPGLMTASRYPSHSSSSGGGSSSSIYAPQQLLTGSPGLQQVQVSQYSFSSTASNQSHTTSWPQLMQQQQQGPQSALSGAAAGGVSEAGMYGALPAGVLGAGGHAAMGASQGPLHGLQHQQHQQHIASPQQQAATSAPGAAPAGSGLHLQELAAALQQMEHRGMVNQDAAAIGGLLGAWAQQQAEQQQVEEQQAQLLSLSQGIPFSAPSGPGQL